MSEYIIDLGSEVLKIYELLGIASIGGWPVKGEIVRCRDCRHYYEADNYHPKGNYIRRCCKYFDTYDDEVTPDGFCAWGERRQSAD